MNICSYPNVHECVSVQICLRLFVRILYGRRMFFFSLLKIRSVREKRHKDMQISTTKTIARTLFEQKYFFNLKHEFSLLIRCIKKKQNNTGDIYEPLWFESSNHHTLKTHTYQKTAYNLAVLYCIGLCCVLFLNVYVFAQTRHQIPLVFIFMSLNTIHFATSNDLYCICICVQCSLCTEFHSIDDCL